MTLYASCQNKTSHDHKISHDHKRFPIGWILLASTKLILDIISLTDSYNPRLNYTFYTGIIQIWQPLLNNFLTTDVL